MENSENLTINTTTEITKPLSTESTQKIVDVAFDNETVKSVRCNGTNESAALANGFDGNNMDGTGIVETEPIVEITPISLDDIKQSSGPEIVSVEAKGQQQKQQQPIEIATPNVAVEIIQPVASIAINPDIGINAPNIALNADNNVSKIPLTSDVGNPLSEFVIKTLEDIATDKGYKDFKINITKGSKHCDGFVAEIYRATISDGKTDNKTVLIVKIPPFNEYRRKMMMRIFERETVVYNQVLPVFEEFQRSKGVKLDRGFYSYPRCYFASFDGAKDESVVIMDDIRSFDFSMENMFRPVKYEHAKSVMIHLGRLHGVSFAMKDQCPEKFEEFKHLRENFDYADATMRNMFEINVKKSIEILNDNEEKIKQKVQWFCDNMSDELKRLNDPELSEPYNVLIHGDCHINNMMFRYESGIPKYVCIYDWQLLRYGSPAIDIAYFIFMCTDKPLRDQHFDHLIQAYHNSLREQLERLGSDVNQLFPFTALIRHLKIFTRFALAAVLFAIPMLCMDRHEIPDMDDFAEKLAQLKPDEVKEQFPMQMNAKAEEAFKIRMGGILRDMSKKGYL